MHLKSLEILGFKSFPEKTVIEFNKGVTAIVGPNGSGKSNITDAIRWVLGEQSVRTLRGDRMEDVIFSGTQTRKAMGYAEVSITIDNADGKLPIDYAEIQVTRRLYRSGESEYLLNRTPCRLKDITMFFMDTGLGRDGYSIVGQGKVDSILSNKPEDRRRVFEEASGIVKFKTRKLEAERRLTATEQNMIRIDDILNELSLQIGPLAEQSERAKNYLRLHDALREKEITLYLDTIRRAMEQMQTCEAETADLLNRLAEQTEAVEKLRESNRGYAEETHAIDAAIAENHRKTMVLNDEANNLSASDRIDRDRIEQIRLRIQESGVEREATGQRILALEEEIATRARKEEGLLRSKSGFDMRLAAAEREMASILQTLGEVERTAEDAKFRLEKLQDTLYDKKEQAGQTRGQVGLIEARRKTVEREIAAAVSERDQVSIRIEEAEAGLRDLEIRIKAAETEQTKPPPHWKRRGHRPLRPEPRWKPSKWILRTENTALRHWPTWNAIARLLRRRQTDHGSQVAGSDRYCRDLLQVAERYETAIETALGNSIQNIVTDTEATAAQEIEHLKKNRLGRATFMPLTTVTDGRWTPDRLNVLPG